MLIRFSSAPLKKPSSHCRATRMVHPALGAKYGLGVTLSNDLTYNRAPPPPDPANTTRRPSGESANEIGSVVGGVVICRDVFQVRARKK